MQLLISKYVRNIFIKISHVFRTLFFTITKFVGCTKATEPILIPNFYVYYEKLKRPEINEERVYHKPKIVGRLSGSYSPPLI